MEGPGGTGRGDFAKLSGAARGRAASTGARVPRSVAVLHAVSGSAPAPPALGSRPPQPGRRQGREEHTQSPAGVAPAGWGRAWRATGEDVRLRACARAAPGFNCRARARFRAPLVPRARLGQWGAGGAGQPGAAEPMSESAQVKGAGLGARGPSACPGGGGGRGLVGVARASGRENKRDSGLVGRGPGNASLRVRPPPGRGEKRGARGGGRDGAAGCHGHRGGRQCRARARGAAGAAGTQGWGLQGRGGVVLPLRSHLVELLGLLKFQPAPDFWVFLLRQY